MQVFKLFMKILRKNLNVIIMYTAIFLAIFLLISQQSDGNNNKKYISCDCEFAYFDYDESDASKYLIDYLKEKDNCVVIKKDDKEVIQDELYNMNVSAVLRIRDGFEKALVEGNVSDYIVIDNNASTESAAVFESHVNGFMKIFDAYIKSGYSVDEAGKAAKEVSEISGNVQMLTQDGAKEYSKTYYFFLYCAYVFITIAVLAVGSIIIVMNRKEVQNRIQCSSYKFSSYYKEVFLGVMFTGLMILLLYFVMAILFYGDLFLTTRGILFILNMICMMLVSLSIAFFATQVVKNSRSLDMIANIIGLGCSFLGGVFVPMQFFGDTVMKIAHFLPTYWYVVACEKIDFYSDSEQLTEIFKCMGVEILFVAAFLAIGMAIARSRKISA